MLDIIFRQDSASPGFTLSYGDYKLPIGAAALRARIRRAAGQLAAAGVTRGDRVLFCGEQGPAAFVAFWATVAVGAAFVPVDPSWPDYLRRLALKKIQPRLLLVEDDIESTHWQALDSGSRVLQLADEATAAAADSQSQSFTPPNVPPELPAACLFTSGTTSDPKVVVLSRAALMHSAALAVSTFEWRAGERLLNLPDPHTMSGLRNAFVAAPLARMHWICAPRSRRPDIFSLLELLEQARPERVVAAPLLLRQINLLGDRVSATALAAIRALYCTGTDLNDSEVSTFHQRFRIPVINYYGLTESVGLCLSQRLRDWAPNDSSIGWPVGCEIRVVDPNGAAVAAGETGELQVRQKFPMSGYLDEPSATAACFSDGWLRTGDIVWQHEDGRITLVGRRSGFIKTQSTDRVHPREIEAVLEQHDSIEAAAVCGLPQPTGGERIAAVLVPREGWTPSSADQKAIAVFVSERLGRERAPAVFRWVPCIPRNTSGKILRNALRELFDA